jgi:UDP-glucose 4-epimerase
MRAPEHSSHEAIGLDIKNSPFTHQVGSITQRSFVKRCMQGVDAVLHTATLHKPHIATHSRQDFVDTNVTGTLILLEEATSAGAPAAWIAEEVTPVPKNIYGVTKLAAENLCDLFHYRSGLPCIVLRTSRFFPEEDDDKTVRQHYNGDNVKVNEFLYRRADLEDIVGAHMLAIEKASMIGFGRYIISATTPFTRADLQGLRIDTPTVVRRYVPCYEEEYGRRGWSMVPTIDRVYVNELARTALGWQPRYDFGYVIQRLCASEDFQSSLARAVGSKGYHAEAFVEGPYPTE